jgi:hypothetical protein
VPTRDRRPPCPQAALMVFNAAAILNEQRFLEKCGCRIAKVAFQT